MEGEVTVKISPTGEVEMEGNNFKGTGCKDLMKTTIEALAGDIYEDRKKPEYFETNDQGVTIGGM